MANLPLDPVGTLSCDPIAFGWLASSVLPNWFAGDFGLLLVNTTVSFAGTIAIMLLSTAVAWTGVTRGFSSWRTASSQAALG